MKIDYYTIKQFNAKFATDEACLDYVFVSRFGNIPACPKCGVVSPRYYRVKGRKCYECRDCGYQLHPLAGTIFHKSSTSLRDWFHIIYMFSVAKNGMSAKEVQRQLGVTYKCAWRLAHQVRLLMQQGGDKLSGIIEADETYIGGKRKHSDPRGDNKIGVVGAVLREGSVKAMVDPDPSASTVLPFLRHSIERKAMLMTDDSKIYYRAKKDFTHQSVNHSIKEFVRGDVHTGYIDGFWSQLKRSLDGTYHCVSPKYLQAYVNERVFHYNHRDEAVFPVLLGMVAQPVR